MELVVEKHGQKSIVKGDYRGHNWTKCCVCGQQALNRQVSVICGQADYRLRCSTGKELQLWPANSTGDCP